MFYYINYLFLYSILGFLLESFYFKLHNANMHSGIFYGPYNFIYGIAMLSCFYVYNKLSLNIITYYFIFTIITTIIEFISGHIIYYLLKIDKWDYTPFKYHFGKYICIRNSLIWGLLSIICIYILNPYLINKILFIIPKTFSISLIILFLIDFILSIIKNHKKKYRHETYINNYF